eukprot:scaffold289155_cov41-Prasinocladus_malaysianus.AAC.2
MLEEVGQELSLFEESRVEDLYRSMDRFKELEEALQMAEAEVRHATNATIMIRTSAIQSMTSYKRMQFLICLQTAVI